MQGRGSCRLDLATSIKEKKDAVYRTYVPCRFLKSSTFLAECQKWHFSISFSEEMVELFDILFVRKSFLGVRPPNNIIKIGY